MNVIDKRHDFPDGNNICHFQQGDCLEEVFEDTEGWFQTGKFYVRTKDGATELKTGVYFIFDVKSTVKFIKIPHAKIIIQ